MIKGFHNWLRRKSPRSTVLGVVSAKSGILVNRSLALIRCGSARTATTRRMSKRLFNENVFTKHVKNAIQLMLVFYSHPEGGNMTDEQIKKYSKVLSDACDRSKGNIERMRDFMKGLPGIQRDNAIAMFQYCIIAMRCMGYTMDETLTLFSLAASRAYEAKDPEAKGPPVKNFGPN